MTRAPQLLPLATLTLLLAAGDTLNAATLGELGAAQGVHNSLAGTSMSSGKKTLGGVRKSLKASASRSAARHSAGSGSSSGSWATNCGGSRGGSGGSGWASGGSGTGGSWVSADPGRRPAGSPRRVASRPRRSR